jgi:hypothetical protein
MYSKLKGRFWNSVTWNSDDDEFTAEHGVSLGGELGEHRYGYIDVSVPSLNPEVEGGFRSEERIIVDYLDEDWGRIHLGSGTLGMRGRLLASNISGRGADFIYYLDPGEAHTFYSRSRIRDQGEMYGAEIIRPVAPYTEVAIGALKTSELETGIGIVEPPEDTTSYNVFAEYDRSGEVIISGELAHSDSEIAGSDSAYHFAGRYVGEELSAGMQIGLAGENFIGRWEDIEFYRVNFGYSLTEKFRISSSYSINNNNVDNDPDRARVENERWRFSASYDFDDDTTVRISHLTGDTVDKNLNSRNREDNRTMYELTRNWDEYRLSTIYEQRTIEDKIRELSTDTDRFRIFGAVDVSPSAEVYAEFSTISSSTTDGSSTDSASYRAGTTFDINDRSSVFLDVRQQTESELGGESTWVSGSWTQEFPNTSRINLRVQNSSGDFGDETAVALDYSIPIAYEMKMFPLYAAVEGRVFNVEDGEGLFGVAVSLNKIETMTDETGYFTFPRLLPMEYNLEVDTTTLGAGQTVNIPLPRTIELSAGDITKVSIPIISSVLAMGRVSMEVSERPGAPVTIQPYRGGIIELTGMGQTVYRYTDGAGGFVFGNLRPGIYKVSLPEDTIPEGYTIEPESYEFEIKAGEMRQDLNFLLKQEERQIIIFTEEEETPPGNGDGGVESPENSEGQ